MGYVQKCVSVCCYGGGLVFIQWKQTQKVQLIVYTIHLFTRKMRDGWHSLQKKPERRLAAIKTVCHHSRIVFFKLHTDITLSTRRSTPKVFSEESIHPGQQKNGISSPHTATVTVVFADKSGSVCLLKVAWRWKKKTSLKICVEVVGVVWSQASVNRGRLELNRFFWEKKQGGVKIYFIISTK